MDSMVLDLLVVCLLHCSAMRNAIENTSKERRVPDNLHSGFSDTNVISNTGLTAHVNC